MAHTFRNPCKEAPNEAFRISRCRAGHRPPHRAPCWHKTKAGWPKGVTIGAAPLGGVYFIWGGAFAKLINDKVGIQANVEVHRRPGAQHPTAAGQRSSISAW